MRGYICENFGAPFRLPELGPIGSNGLANARDFLTPRARYEDLDVDCELMGKFSGRLWIAPMDHSPLDVVAWHGNYAPYKYDLRRFNTMGSVSYDHPDPSIFLVLHSPSDTPGTSNIDFVIFPPRWLAMQNTFRPPWFHRNVANEFMGLIAGVYDAKSTGFVPGGASLHNCMSGHGPDAATFDKATAADTSLPAHIADTMAFMFETRLPIQPTRCALQGTPALQQDYMAYWLELKKRFDPASSVIDPTLLDETHDPRARSWLDSANRIGCDFPIQNLPFAVFRRADSAQEFRCGVAIGDQIIDLAALARLAVFEGQAAQGIRAGAQLLAQFADAARADGLERRAPRAVRGVARGIAPASHAAQLSGAARRRAIFIARANRRLHRFLHLDSSRHGGRPTDAAGQSVAAELPLDTDRLPWPQLPPSACRAKLSPGRRGSGFRPARRSPR